MKLHKPVFSLLFIFIFIYGSSAQIKNKLSLKDAIQQAQKNSLDYKIAFNTVTSSYWDLKSYEATLLPKLILRGDLPNYYRTINNITLPSGENSFVTQNVANSSLSINLLQNIGLTGGSLIMASSLYRIDNFGVRDSKAYTAVPLTLSYKQSSIFYNEFKWRKKLEPLKYQEAIKSYLETLEQIAYNTTLQYFELYASGVQLRLERQNLQNIDTLYRITQARFSIGTAQLNEVLQARVSLLNVKKAVSNSILAFEIAQQNMIRQLGYNNVQIDLELPDNITFFEIDPTVALQYSRENGKAVIEHQRKRLEAEQEIDRTKSQADPSVSINTNLGLTQTGYTLTSSYVSLLRNQSLSIGLEVPLMDWGVNKANIRRAKVNLELQNSIIAQQKLAVDQEISYQIMKWRMLQEQIAIAKETSELAMQRYEIARQKYSLGTISFTDFSNAQLDKDRAVIGYNNNLRDYWLLYYLIRKLTLFDFEQNTPLEMPELIIN